MQNKAVQVEGSSKPNEMNSASGSSDEQQLVRCDALIGEQQFKNFFNEDGGKCALVRCNALVGEDQFQLFYNKKRNSESLDTENQHKRIKMPNDTLNQLLIRCNAIIGEEQFRNFYNEDNKTYVLGCNSLVGEQRVNDVHNEKRESGSGRKERK